MYYNVWEENQVELRRMFKAIDHKSALSEYMNDLETKNYNSSKNITKAFVNDTITDITHTFWLSDGKITREE